MISTIVSSAFLLSSLASSAFDCDRTVVDETGKVGNIAAVEAAADRLVNAGASVRVRVIPNASEYGGIDQYQAAMQKKCSSWRTADNRRRSNLVVMVVSTDLKSGLYHGERFSRALDGRTDAIRNGRIAPRLAANDFAGGLVSGLDAVRENIEAAGSDTDAMPASMIAPALPAASRAQEMTPLWIFLDIVILVAAILMIGAGIRSLLKMREKRRVARMSMLSSVKECADRIEDIGRRLAQIAQNLNGSEAVLSDLDRMNFRFRLVNLNINAEHAVKICCDLTRSVARHPRLPLSKCRAFLVMSEGVLICLEGISSDTLLLQKDISDSASRNATTKSSPDVQ